MQFELNCAHWGLAHCIMAGANLRATFAAGRLGSEMLGKDLELAVRF
jgi:hypothetical protein